MNNNRLTIIESPFAGQPTENLRYLKRCINDSIKRGETPFASHGFFPHFLDDKSTEERKTGISLGFRFWDHAERIVFYIDLGMSPGMLGALENWVSFYATQQGLPIMLRRIGAVEEKITSDDIMGKSPEEVQEMMKARKQETIGE